MPTTPKKTMSKNPTTKTAPHATQAEHAALARAETKIHALLHRGEDAAWKAGRAFDALARAGLHHAAGFATLEEYAEARFPQGYRTLKRCRRVALAFRSATVIKYGTTKLDVALSYIALTPEHERASEIPSLVFRVPDKSGKKAIEVAFAKATVTQIERAIQLAKAKPTASDDVLHARAKRVRNELQTLVAAPKGTRRHAPAVRSHVTDDRGLRVDVVGVDLDDLERVGKALIAMGNRLRATRKAAA